MKVTPMNLCSIPGKYTSCFLLQTVQTGPEVYRLFQRVTNEPSPG